MWSALGPAGPPRQHSDASRREGTRWRKEKRHGKAGLGAERRGKEGRKGAAVMSLFGSEDAPIKVDWRRLHPAVRT